MEFEELMRFIETENKRLNERYKITDHKIKVLGKTVKLSEELGELCNEILAYNSFQRKEKLDNQNKDSLSEEFADVIITTLLLSKEVNVDIIKSLKNKIEKINKRY